jgi:hypothetical protein
MSQAELKRIQQSRTAGSGFKFSLFRANEKNKIASGRQGNDTGFRSEQLSLQSQKQAN